MHAVLAGALDGVRILDMTSVLMGPYATQILGDYGADVIKIESFVGDTTRQIPPMRNAKMGYAFLHLNRNKRSLVLDLKKPEGVTALLKLAGIADLLVYNVRPQAMARLGLNHERLAVANPRIISVGLMGFGQDGPYAPNPAYEDLIQGLTALPSMLTAAGAERPVFAPVSISDRAVGLNAAIAMVSALYRRDRSGRGQEIRIPMFETMAQFTLGDHMAGQSFEPPLGAPGYPRTLTKERRPFATRDGYICVIVYNDKQWTSFFKLIGRTELMADPRLKDLRGRTENTPYAYGLVAEALKTRTTAEWLDILRSADIPAAPLHTLESLVDDPHLKAVGLFQTVEHPSEGTLRQIGIPSTWSESRPTIRRQAPRLGEHSGEVLREAGFSDEQIKAMIEGKVTLQA
jgi:crotonobetainyl-CoA:carnitine CoA-transferase CaiB-like acyl-CoA transferase